MSTTVDYIEYVCEQIGEEYDVRCRKMFGDYMVYVNDKPVILVCDNCVYVKKIKELNKLMENSESGFPYCGAKEHYILDIEDAKLVDSVVEILEKFTPKRRVKKK
ncbi:MAG: hypothetical protein J1G04_02415 [Clostridiales bacterium]|nr:hypothetical protein [Clostridiales bacterium]